MEPLDLIPTSWFVINVWAMCGVQLLPGSYHEPLCRGPEKAYLSLISNIRLTNELLLKVSKSYIAL